MAQNNRVHEKVSIEQFENQLAEGDRWIELVGGRLIRHEPPDEVHGDVIRNLSRPLATYAAGTKDLSICFELAVVLSRNEQTIRCPAISCFQSEDRFAETDKLITDSCPRLVIEVASTNSRREGMADRVSAYLSRSIQEVWIIDPVSRQIHLFNQGHPATKINENDDIKTSLVLPRLSIPVRSLFQQPKWAT